MCFPTTSKFLPLSCNSALVLLIGNASWCSWQISSVIYTYQFIFNQVNCSSFWLPENSPVTRKSFNKILPRMYHLDDSFGCSSGNRMVCNTATYSVPQTLGRVFLAPGREQILLIGPVSPVKHWNVNSPLAVVCVKTSYVLPFLLIPLYLNSRFGFLCVTEDSELGCRVQEFLTLGSITGTPPEVSVSISSSWG